MSLLARDTSQCPTSERETRAKGSLLARATSIRDYLGLCVSCETPQEPGCTAAWLNHPVRILTCRPVVTLNCKRWTQTTEKREPPKASEETICDIAYTS
jgi:hypothetical protein